MKRRLMICGILIIFCMLVAIGNAENYVSGKDLLEKLLSSYSTGNVVLSHQVQIVHSAVNFRESPGGKVIASLNGGEILNVWMKSSTREICGTMPGLNNMGTDMSSALMQSPYGIIRPTGRCLSRKTSSLFRITCICLLIG